MLVTDNATVSEIYLNCQDLLLFILKDNPRALIDISDDFVVEVKKAEDTDDTNDRKSIVSYSTDEGDYSVSGYIMTIISVLCIFQGYFFIRKIL